MVTGCCVKNVCLAKEGTAGTKFSDNEFVPINVQINAKFITRGWDLGWSDFPETDPCARQRHKTAPALLA